MQKFLNNFNTTFIASVKDVAVTGTPSTELDYGVLRLSDGAAGLLTNPTGGGFYVLTAYKKSGTLETNIEIMKVTAVDNATVNECRITVLRAQEGTPARAYVSGDYISLRLTAGGTAQFAQLADLTKAAVGLGNVDNTSDAAKPVSTAQQTALNLKANLASPTFTGVVAGITAAMVGAPSGSGTVSGANTGDQTSITGNAGSATALSAGADRTKLDAITGTNTGDQTTITGNAGTATALSAGADRTKLDGIATGATANVGDVTLAGVQTLTNKTITETVFALTGTTPAFLATNGAVQTWTLTAASSPTNALTTGQSIILAITPGSFAITWPAGTVWTKVGGSGVAPALFSAGKTTVVLWRVGTVLYGSTLGDTA